VGVGDAPEARLHGGALPIALLALLAPSASAGAGDGTGREPVAWALEVEGHVTGVSGRALHVGDAIEPDAVFHLDRDAIVRIAHGGRIEEWDGPADVTIGRDAVRVRTDAGTTRTPHEEDAVTGLAGRIRAPIGHDQVYGALGVPLTAGAWARQDRIDGGVLHAAARTALFTRLAQGGVDDAEVTKAGLVDGLAGSVVEQEGLVRTYLSLAGQARGAALLLELSPTYEDPTRLGGRISTTLLQRAGGGLPHTFRANAEVDKIRTYSLDLADSLRRRGYAVFALVVPYANTIENIVARNGRPEDGADALHHYLETAARFGEGSDLTTVAFGYSQGAAAVRAYVARYGDADGLDYAVPLAVMGGADGRGAEGVWAGTWGRKAGAGVAMLSVVNAGDPARWIYGRTLVALAPRLANYVEGHGALISGDRSLHEGYYGSRFAPVPYGADRDAALAVGLFGYPTAYLAPLYDALFQDRYVGVYERRADWRYDAREELVHPDKGDFATWRQDPVAIAEATLAGAW
jgi:hypothetical protein